MFCKNCGSTIPDGSAVCPYCSAVQEPAAPQQPAGYEQPQYQQAPQQPQYQQPTGYEQPQYQQPQYQQPYQQPMYDAQAVSSAKNMGIIAIIGGIFIPLLGWILGGIGSSKAKNVLAVAPGLPEAEQAAKLCKIGIIVASISFLIGVIGNVVLQNM